MGDTIETPKKQTLFNDFMDMIESIIFSLFIVIMIFTYLFKVATVDGKSMQPTLYNDDKLIVSALGYEPDNGDIVIINSEELEKKIVKRIIANEGQTIDIDFIEHKVYVDGIELFETYISEPTALDEGAFEYPVTVPEDCVFVMGDNRNNSKDSRHTSIGYVNKKDIVGKVILRIFPFNKVGKIQ